MQITRRFLMLWCSDGHHDPTSISISISCIAVRFVCPRVGTLTFTRQLLTDFFLQTHF